MPLGGLLPYASPDTRIQGLVGSLMAQNLPRGMLPGNPAQRLLGLQGRAGQGAGPGNLAQLPDGTLDPTPLNLLMERVRFQNAVTKLRNKQRQQLMKAQQAQLAGPGGGRAPIPRLG